ADIRRLTVQQHVDLGRLPMEAVLLIADRPDGSPCRGTKPAWIDGRVALLIHNYVAVLILFQKAFRHANLARDHDAIGGSQRFASDPNPPGVHPFFLCLAIDKIHDFVGDTITDLVRMTFGNGFTGKKIVPAWHGLTPLRKKTQPILA